MGPRIKQICMTLVITVLQLCLAVQASQKLPDVKDQARTPDLLDDIVRPKPSRLRSGLADFNKDWPGGYIPFVFDGSLNAHDRAKVQRAMDHYRRITCINWVQRTNQRHYVLIKKPPDQTCNSYVGKLGIGKQDLNLAQWCLDSFPAILHEMMHCIGFEHEQSRPDRDNHINIYWENIGEKSRWLFQKVAGSWTYGTTYDYRSVMHYTAYAGSKNGRMTMTPKDGTDPNILGQAKDLSVTDYYRIKLMYNCDGNYDGRNRYTPDPNCKDKHANCNTWARKHYPSECEKSAAYMMTNCERSCRVCGPKLGCYTAMYYASTAVYKNSANECKRHCYLDGYKYAGYKTNRYCTCSDHIGGRTNSCRNSYEVYNS